MARASEPVWVPGRGEAIWIQHSPAVGGEIPELHPMLVSSTRAFNERVGIVIGFPVTHSQQHHDNPFALHIVGPKGKAYVLAHQPKSFDWRARCETSPLGWRLLRSFGSGAGSARRHLRHRSLTRGAPGE
jgi:mRNA interferase MazF